jgi:hypothetical protein
MLPLEVFHWSKDIGSVTVECKKGSHYTVLLHFYLIPVLFCCFGPFSLLYSQVNMLKNILVLAVTFCSFTFAAQIPSAGHQTHLKTPLGVPYQGLFFFQDIHVF